MFYKDFAELGFDKRKHTVPIEKTVIFAAGFKQGQHKEVNL